MRVRYLGSILLLLSAVVFSIPQELTDQFVSTLTVRKYYKYDAALNKYIEYVKQEYVNGQLKDVNYVAYYVNNDKYWIGKYSSFGTGAFLMNGINYDFYTEESYYLFRLVADEPIGNDASESQYALDMICGKYFTKSNVVTIEVVQLPWSFSDLYEKRDVWTYNANEIVEELSAGGQVAGELNLTLDRSLVEPYDKISARVFLANLKANERIYEYDVNGVTHKQYEYGIYTLRVKNSIDFTKCGGVKDYRLRQGDVSVAASLTDASGVELTGLNNGLMLNVCVNGYTTPGWGWTIENIWVRHRSILQDQLPPPEITGPVACPSGCYRWFTTWETPCIVSSGWQLFQSLTLTQAGVAGELIYFEGVECSGVAPQLASLSDVQRRAISRSVSVEGYKIDWGDNNGVRTAYSTSPVSHTYTKEGTYTVRVYAIIKVQSVDIGGDNPTYTYPEYEIANRKINVRPRISSKTFAALNVRPKLTPLVAILRNISHSSGQTEWYRAWQSIIAGPSFFANSNSTVSLIAPAITLAPDFNALSGSSVSIRASNNPLLKTVDYHQHQSLLDTPKVEPVADRPNLKEGNITNRPNPFNPSTIIYYNVQNKNSGDVRVVVRVYDVTGNSVKTLVDGRHASGTFKTIWDATDSHGRPVSGGVYFCELEAGKHKMTKKMILLR